MSKELRAPNFMLQTLALLRSLLTLSVGTMPILWARKMVDSDYEGTSSRMTSKAMERLVVATMNIPSSTKKAAKTCLDLTAASGIQQVLSRRPKSDHSLFDDRPATGPSVTMTAGSWGSTGRRDG